MPRTDFTSEIDGALAGRNLGSRHFSEVARSGNGNMLSDLTSEDQLADYQELDGLGEAVEELSTSESAAIDRAGPVARVARFRSLKPGETPPFAAKPGMFWVRKRVPVNQRRPGGNRLARVKWAQVSPKRYQKLAQQGDVQGLGGIEFGTMSLVSLGIGAVAGLAAWMLIRKARA